MIMLIFSALVVYQATNSYHEALQEGEADALRLNRILADHTELTFLGVDLALRRAIERQYLNALLQKNVPAYMKHNFELWLAETPQISTLAIIDANGNATVTANKPGYENWLNYSTGTLSKALFDNMRDTDDNHVFFGKHETAEGDMLIVMSRRYTKPDGSFGGLAVATITPRYFMDFYESIAYGERKYMAITLNNGEILAHGPFSSHTNQNTMLRIIKGYVQPKVNKKLRIYLTTAANGIKITASQQLNVLPILVNVILEEEDVLEDWKRNLAILIGILVFFIAFGSVFSFLSIAMAKHIQRAEESEETAILASQAKSEFLANMSHELRTPLNAIIGFSEMINSGYFGELNTKQHERIHDINLCGTHLLQLINDILEFSKGDAGKLDLQEEEVDVSEIIDECTRILESKIKSSQVEVIAYGEPDMKPLWADKRKLRQVLLNLMSNSLKFTPDNGHIRVNASIDNHQCIHILVADTGIGIPEDQIPRALSVFGQVHRSQSHEGTGLGLPLCKMYTELHGGKLILSSKVGEGTTVRLVFPAERTIIPMS